MTASIGPGDPVSFWLIPAEPALSRLQATIDGLSTRFGSPRFGAHITMEVGVAGGTPVATIVDLIATEFPVLELACGATRHTDARFKTLFIEFDDPALFRMHRRMRALLGTGSSYHFAPHLSLVYGPLPVAERTALAGDEDHRGEVIRFDAVAIGLPAAGASDWGAVEGWRIIQRRRLLGTA